jgi:hypothetical protein
MSAEVARAPWWQYWRRAELCTAIDNFDRVIAMTLHTKTVMPMMASTGQVFPNALAIFAPGDLGILAML